MPKTGTFLVTEADDDAAVLRDVADGQVHTLAANPGLDPGTVLEATIEPDPPLEVTWTLADVADRRTVSVERVDERPADRAVATAPDEIGAATTYETGEATVHVLAVPVGDTGDAVGDVVADEATLVRAARLGARTVEVRGADGVVTVRYRSD